MMEEVGDNQQSGYSQCMFPFVLCHELNFDFFHLICYVKQNFESGVCWLGCVVHRENNITDLYDGGSCRFMFV